MRAPRAVVWLMTVATSFAAGVMVELTREAERMRHVRESLRKDLVEENARLTKLLAEKQLLLSMAESKGPCDTRLIAGPPIPRIEGKVLAIWFDKAAPEVRLSAGALTGVEPGYTFSVYRRHEFVGKVVAFDVSDHHCDARLLFCKEGAIPVPGDSASTRLD